MILFIFLLNKTINSIRIKLIFNRLKNNLTFIIHESLIHANSVNYKKLLFKYVCYL